MLLELELPFWIDAEDCRVEFGERQLSVDVRNTLRLERTYWRNRWVRSGRAAGARWCRACACLLRHAPPAQRACHASTKPNLPATLCSPSSSPLRACAAARRRARGTTQ